jgi:hypothetical protein
MFSLTQKALEDFDNPSDFERMCADLLTELGYQDVVPIAPRGGSDGGKDITFKTSNRRLGLACVTLRKDIEAKFKEDFSKRRPGDFETYMLFCTAYLTAAQKTKFSDYCRVNLHADFEPRDIEVLRNLLDTKHGKIRERYIDKYVRSLTGSTYDGYIMMLHGTPSDLIPYLEWTRWIGTNITIHPGSFQAARNEPLNAVIAVQLHGEAIALGRLNAIPQGYNQTCIVGQPSDAQSYDERELTRVPEWRHSRDFKRAWTMLRTMLEADNKVS